jgi:hypothetical protein
MMTTNTMHKAIKVGHCDPGENCEIPGCDRLPVNWSITRGSGYVTACMRHAQELIDQAVEGGDIYQR